MIRESKIFYEIKHRYLLDSKGDKRSKNTDSLIKFEYIES